MRSDGGNIYGQKDIECDCSDREVFEAVAKILPRHAVWYSSNLKRTHQTAEAIWAAGFPKPVNMTHEVLFAEQNLGKWQGMNRKEFIASLPLGRHWLTEVNEPAPGGESFMDLYIRTCSAIARITAAEAGRDVVAVAHGGTIRAAVGLALGGLPERGLAFDIDNCSVTRLDHIATPHAASGGCRWSTSSHGWPTPRMPPCISRRGRRLCNPNSRRNMKQNRRNGRSHIWERDA